MNNKPARRKENREIAAVVAQSFSGPLPPPDVLVKYNEAIPNGAERIMAMTESQSAHRMKLEELVVRANIKNQTRGSIFAFTLCVIALAIGAWLIWAGKSVQGVTSIIVAMTSLTLVFVVGRFRQEKERRDKQAPLRQDRD